MFVTASFSESASWLSASFNAWVGEDNNETKKYRDLDGHFIFFSLSLGRSVQPFNLCRRNSFRNATLATGGKCDLVISCNLVGRARQVTSGNGHLCRWSVVLAGVEGRCEHRCVIDVMVGDNGPNVVDQRFAGFLLTLKTREPNKKKLNFSKGSCFA